ncbi:hypothetical protein [Botrimarina sp.]|uniref:hypothetical protein n=1 Tax=Botrimarina sp. TaxID=2795802 RepID=UPI0032ED1077
MADESESGEADERFGAINRTLNGLNSARAALQCLIGNAEVVCRYAKTYDFVFAPDGSFAGLSKRRSAAADPQVLDLDVWESQRRAQLAKTDDAAWGMPLADLIEQGQRTGALQFLAAIPDDDFLGRHARDAATYYERLPELTESLWAAGNKADAGVQRLPQPFVTALNGLRPGWRPRIRRDLLDPLRRWPAQRGFGMAAALIPDGAREFTRLVFEGDPRPEWSEAIDLIYEAEADLIAVRGEAGESSRATAPPEPVGSFSAEALVRQFGGSIRESSWHNASATDGPRTETQFNRAAPVSPLARSLSRLREHFVAGLDRHPPLIGVMVHHEAPLSFPEPHWPSRMLDGKKNLFVHGGTVSAYGPTDDPLRKLGVYAEESTQERLTEANLGFGHYCRIADEADALLGELPQPLLRSIWSDWPAEYWRGSEFWCWIAAVFELAFKKYPLSGLSAERFVWDEESGYGAPVPTAAQLDGSQGASNWVIDLVRSTVRPAPYWYSKIDNLWQASVAAVDLLALLLEAASSGTDAKPGPTPPANQSAALPTIDELEKATPPLSHETGQWVKNTRAAELEGLSTGTLSDYRLPGEKTADKMFGRDKDGRIWRRQGTANAHPWYLRSSLRSQSKP